MSTAKAIVGVILKQQRGFMAIKTFTAIIHKEEALYVTHCLEVGTVDQGQTIESAIANLKEATQLYLEEFPLADASPRFFTTFDLSPEKF